MLYNQVLPSGVFRLDNFYVDEDNIKRYMSHKKDCKNYIFQFNAKINSKKDDYYPLSKFHYTFHLSEIEISDIFEHISNIYAICVILQKMKRFKESDYYNIVLEDLKKYLPDTKEDNAKIDSIENFGEFFMLHKVFNGYGINIYEYLPSFEYKMEDFNNWTKELQELCRGKLWRYFKEWVTEIRENEVESLVDDTKLTEAYMIRYYLRYCGCCPADENYYGPYRTLYDAEQRLEKLTANIKDEKCKQAYKIERFDIERLQNGNVVMGGHYILDSDIFQYIDVLKNGRIYDLNSEKKLSGEILYYD